MLTMAMLKHYTCMCPLRLEQRVERVYQHSLLDQLTSEASGYAPSVMGSRGGKPGSKPPATLDMLDLVQTIDMFLCKAGAEGKTRIEKLRNLVMMSMKMYTVEEPSSDEWTRRVCVHLRKFIKTARIMLQYDVPSRVLRDAVCGGCGGTLAVAVDATSDVRCVGKSGATSCGQVYRRYEWVDLLERGEHA
jgi:hypothetical protein